MGQWEKSAGQFKGVTSFVGKQRQVIHYTHQLSGCDILYMQPLLLTDCILIQQAGKLAEFKTKLSADKIASVQCNSGNEYS